MRSEALPITSPWLRSILARCADWLAIAVAVALPWSTTITGALIGLWAVTLIGSWDLAERWRKEPWLLAGILPIALCLLGAVGTLWAHVPRLDRLDGLIPFGRLLAIPALAIQFRDSPRAKWLAIAFLISCTLLLVLSWALALLPNLSWRGRYDFLPGVPVKDYIAQGQFFTLCAFGLLETAHFAWRGRRRRQACVLALGSLPFLANPLYVAPSRTALATIPVLVVLMAFRHLGRRSAAIAIATVAIAAAGVWQTSPTLRYRTMVMLEEVGSYESGGKPTSAGERLEFWRKSIALVAQAPLLGHGTGSTEEQFRRLAVGQAGVAAEVTANPHNQILTIAIQLGLVGAALLLAMWGAHVRLFCAPGIWAGWGLLVVVQNIVGCLFNSHLFDFTQGWTYVWGVGALAGPMIRSQLRHGREKEATLCADEK